jgi:hypothetical protein
MWGQLVSLHTWGGGGSYNTNMVGVWGGGGVLGGAQSVSNLFLQERLMLEFWHFLYRGTDGYNTFPPAVPL